MAVDAVLLENGPDIPLETQRARDAFWCRTRNCRLSFPRCRSEGDAQRRAQRQRCKSVRDARESHRGFYLKKGWGTAEVSGIQMGGQAGFPASGRLSPRLWKYRATTLKQIPTRPRLLDPTISTSPSRACDQHWKPRAPKLSDSGENHRSPPCHGFFTTGRPSQSRPRLCSPSFAMPAVSSKVAADIVQDPQTGQKPSSRALAGRCFA